MDDYERFEEQVCFKESVISEALERKELSYQKLRPSTKKTKRITLRMCPMDFLRLRERAFDERMPYQTLLTRLIHGYLKERRG